MSKNSNCEPDDDDNNDDNDDDNDDNDNNDDNDDNDNDNDEDNNDDIDNKTLRKGCYVKRFTRHVTRVHLGGHGIGHSEQSEDI